MKYFVYREDSSENADADEWIVFGKGSLIDSTFVGYSKFKIEKIYVSITRNKIDGIRDLDIKSRKYWYVPENSEFNTFSEAAHNFIKIIF
jgi:hypothetical protein